MEHAGHDYGLHILFHPVFVHFPIAFYFLELILLIFWFVKRDPNYLRFARFSFRSGYLFMLVAIVAGLIDAGGINGIVGHVRPHVYAAASVFVLYTARACFWRFAREEQEFYKHAQLLSALVGNILVALTGYFGGVIVYG